MSRLTQSEIIDYLKSVLDPRMHDQLSEHKVNWLKFPENRQDVCALVLEQKREDRERDDSVYLIWKDKDGLIHHEEAVFGDFKIIQSLVEKQGAIYLTYTTVFQDGHDKWWAYRKPLAEMNL